MNWLLLLKGLLTATVYVSKVLSNKKLLEAGAATQLNKTLLEEKKRVQKAIDARNSIKHDADSVSDDPNNRG